MILVNSFYSTRRKTKWYQIKKFMGIYRVQRTLTTSSSSSSILAALSTRDRDQIHLKVSQNANINPRPTKEQNFHQTTLK